ncbi:conserved hypothetical protein [Segatella oris C735]|uniref:HU domain-containing protein n=1 Tax=Segatella oris C735 TaxID=563008 RepID=D7NG86_9BACT|nr:conserved hypothetical protein [Segatella oris C735]
MKYYPQMAPTTPMSLAQIVKRVEKRLTVSSADVKAVLEALQFEVMEALENGNTVRLGDLCRVYIILHINFIFQKDKNSIYNRLIISACQMMKIVL